MVHPETGEFCFFFALNCLGVKMKNPETETISGFCCKLHFHSAEKEGLLSMITGGNLAEQITPLFASLIGSFYFHLSSLRRA
jgi:hypothetical protein